MESKEQIAANYRGFTMRHSDQHINPSIHDAQLRHYYVSNQNLFVVSSKTGHDRFYKFLGENESVIKWNGEKVGKLCNKPMK